MRPPGVSWIRARVSALAPQVCGILAGNGPVDDLRLETAMMAVYMECMPKGTPVRKPEWNALYSTVSHLKGREPDAKMVRANLQRAVANWHLIRDATPVPEWDGGMQYCAVAFLSAVPEEQREGRKPSLQVRARVLTGIAAGLVLDMRLTRAYVQYFLGRGSGAGRLDPACEELAGMEANAALHIRDGRPRFESLDGSQSQRLHNRRLTETRHSTAGKCERGIMCHLCSETTDNCRWALWPPAATKKG